MKKTFILTLFMMLCSLAFAQNAGQNSYDWGEFNYHNYPTTEHVFATLTLDGKAAENIQNYEIAPFCGTELRGDAVKALNVNDKNVFWFSVYGGNAEEPETITFKLYDYATGTLFDNVSETTVTYGNNNGVNIGSYAEPIVINFNHVAEVADVKYGSLAKAVEVAAAGQTVKVINDVVLAKGLVVEKNLTFDLNGKAITATEGVYPVIRIQNEANVTVTGNGSITNATDYVFVLGDTNIATSGYLTIENGTFLGGTTVASVTKGNLTINGGDFSVNPYQGTVYSYLINCYDASFKNGTATVAIKGGTFHNWNPENNAAEGEGTNFCPQAPVRYIAVEDPANTFTVKEGAWIAQIEDGTKFQTLAAAVEAAPEGTTVTLLESATGAGVVIDKDVTINFADYTYTFNEGVGSTGTQTNGLQILKGHEVTLINGTLNVAEAAADKFYILVQNYADLNVVDMNLDGTNLDKYSKSTDPKDGDSYVLSNNSGKVNISGETNITANNDGDKAFAFDVCDKTSWGYSVPTVNVTTTGIITGAIEVSEAIKNNLNISSGKFTTEIQEAWCAEGYIPTEKVDGYYSVKEGAYVARNMNTDKGYETLPAAVNAAEAGHTINLLADVKLTGKYTIAKAVTIDGKGHSIMADENSSFGTKHLIGVNSSNVTLKDVVLNCKNTYNINVYCAQNVVFDNVSIINATGGFAALTVNGSTLTTKTSFKALGNLVAIDISNGKGVTSALGLTVKEGTVYDLRQNDTKNAQVKFASVADNDVTGAVDAEGGRYFVAKNSVQYYASLADAVTGTSPIEVIADHTTKTPAVITKDLTLNLNGKAITAAEGVYPVIRIQNNANVTVTGNGSITNATDYVFVLGSADQKTAGNLTIENGTFLGGTTVASVTKGNLTIKGGEFSVNPYQGTVYSYLINCYDASYKNGTATVAITGGTFHNWNPENNAAEGEGTNFCPNGYKAFEGENETYTVSVILPEVVVTNIKETLKDTDPDLTFALNFAIKDIDKLTDSYLEDLMAKYGKHYVDYVLTIEGMNDENGTVTFNANGDANGYLAGQYDAWSENWLSVPFENVVVKNGESFYIMEYAAKLLGQSGLRFTLAEIAEIVQNFDCGVYFTNEFLVANPNLKVTLVLKVFTEDENGAKIDNIDVAENVFEVSGIEAIVSATGKQTQYCAKLATAIETAIEDATVTLLRNVESSEIIAINKDLTIDLSGKTVTSTAKKAFEVYADATIKNGTINGVNRCVDTRKAVELTLSGVTLNANDYTSTYGNPQPLTIGGSENGTKVNMTDVNISAKAGYGIISFVKTELTATNSTISGYNALYVKPGSEKSTFNFVNSTLSGSTADNDVEGNSFSTIALRADNVTVNVDKDSKVTSSGDYCHAISLGGDYSGEEATSGNNITIAAGTIVGKILSDKCINDNTVKINENYATKLHDEGYATSAPVEGLVTVLGKAVASVNGTLYATLQAAVDAADGDDDVVVLVASATGAGVVIDKDVTIDFASYTYTANKAVGSTGTVTLGFQILKNNTVTLKGGTFVAGEGILMLVQNYANLNVVDMNLDGTSEAVQYVLSNNSGTVNVSGKTNITASANGVAFDVFDYTSAGYTVPTVNVETTGTITGAIEVSESIKYNLNIKAGTFTNEIMRDWCHEDYVPTQNTDATWTVRLGNFVAEVEGKVKARYETIAEAIARANGEEGAQTITVLAGNTTSTPAVITKDLTLNLNGKAITAAEGVYPVIRIQNDANVTVTGNGSITNADDYVFVLGDTNIAKSGYLTIENGTFLGGTTVASVTKGNLTINGGEFSVNPYQGTVYSYLINCYDASYKNGTATVAIKGGTFHEFNPENNAAEGEGTNFCAAGYAAKETPSNVWTVVSAQRHMLAQGWNWYSSYIASDDLFAQLQDELATSCVQIKNHEGLYNGSDSNGDWIGGLNAISVKEMYMIKLNAEEAVFTEGPIANPAEQVIGIHKKWSWIGYPMTEAMSVKEALKGLTPNDGDIIKAHNGAFTTFIDGYGWVEIPGASNILNSMEPGNGYMYYSYADVNKEFNYSYPTTNSRSAAFANVTAEDNYWAANTSVFANNMTIVAALNVEGVEMGEGVEVAAFVNGEVRGSARPFYVEAIDSYVMFLSVYGNDQEEVTFKYIDLYSEEEYTLNNKVVYADNAIIGSVAEPMTLCYGTLGIGENAANTISLYPNPTTTHAAINFETVCDVVEVFNSLGVRVAEYRNVDSIDGLEAAGVYVIRVTNGETVQNCRLIVK